jgi:SOS-response transcriptional repressor LexA
MISAARSIAARRAARTRARLAAANPHRLPRRQAELLSFIRTTFNREGKSPDYPRMREFMGHVSNGGITQMLDSLQSRGLIARERWRHHGIRPIESPPSFKKTVPHETEAVASA